MAAINYRLWGSILLIALLPAIYSTTRIYFLNMLPDTWSVSIAAQASWLHLAYEVLQEAIVLPLYFVFGQVIRDRAALRERVIRALLVTLAAYAAMTLGVLLGADWLTRAMAQQAELQAVTARFVRLESLAILIGTLNDICIVVVVALGLHRLVMALAFARAALTILFDALFFGQFAFSLDGGVIGVALTNLSTGGLLFVVSAVILHRQGVLGLPQGPLAGGWMRQWFRVARRSGLESGVRNLAFSLMILRLVNEVQEAGLFWVTNSFIWGWLLLPVLSLGTLVRQDAGRHGGRLDGRFAGYLWLIALIVLVWLVTMPGWTWFIATAMGSPEAQRVFSLALLMLGFYVVFAFNHVLDSYFYGTGRTDLLLYQSLFVSIFYYGAAYVLWLNGGFVPDLRGLALLFGGGMAIDSLLTLWQFRRTGCWQLARQRHDPAGG